MSVSRHGVFGISPFSTAAAPSTERKRSVPLPALESITVPPVPERYRLAVDRLKASTNPWIMELCRASKDSKKGLVISKDRQPGLKSFRNDFSRDLLINGQNRIDLFFLHFNALKEKFAKECAGDEKNVGYSVFKKLSQFIIDNKLDDRVGKANGSANLPPDIEKILNPLLDDQINLFYEIILCAELGDPAPALVDAHYSQTPSGLISGALMMISSKAQGKQNENKAALAFKQPGPGERVFNLHRDGDACLLKIIDKRFPVISGNGFVGSFPAESESFWCLEEEGFRLSHVVAPSLISDMLLTDYIEDLDNVLQKRLEWINSPKGGALAFMRDGVAKRIKALENQESKQRQELKPIQDQFEAIAQKDLKEVEEKTLNNLAELQGDLLTIIGQLTEDLNRLMNLQRFIAGFYKGWITSASVDEYLGDYLLSKIPEYKKMHKDLIQSEAFYGVQQDILGKQQEAKEELSAKAGGADELEVSNLQAAGKKWENLFLIMKQLESGQMNLHEFQKNEELQKLLRAKQAEIEKREKEDYAMHADGFNIKARK